MGLITPIGNTVDETWTNALAGRSGGNLIEHFDTSDFAVKIGANVKNFDVEQYLDRKEARRIDVFIQLGIAAGIQAIDNAGIADLAERDRIGVAIGSGTQQGRCEQVCAGCDRALRLPARDRRGAVWRQGELRKLEPLHADQGQLRRLE